MAEEKNGFDRRGEVRGEDLPPDMDVRDADLEPHEGLRYIARLFKILAVLLILLLIFEIVAGLIQQGNSAIPRLMVEATRLIVFAGFLWGAGDLALMLIESNHDLRATRILVGRLNGKLGRFEQHYLGGGGRGAGGARTTTGGPVIRPSDGPAGERPPSHREPPAQ